MNELPNTYKSRVSCQKGPIRHAYAWPIGHFWSICGCWVISGSSNACKFNNALAARFMGPIRGLSGAERTQVGAMLAPWTLLSGCFIRYLHVNIMPGKSFLHYWPFVRGLHWRPVDSLTSEPVMSFDVFFVVSMNKLLNKLLWNFRWLTILRPLCDYSVMNWCLFCLFAHIARRTILN